MFGPPAMTVLAPEIPARPARGKPVGAVVAALRLLRCLGRHAQPRRLSDLARELDLNPSTVLNILRTLEVEGLIAADPETKRYSLAQGLADLAAPVADRDGRERQFARALDASADELGATVALWRRTGDKLELVQVAESSAVMRIAFTVGRRMPLFVGALGRLAAAGEAWSEADLRTGFAAVAWARPPGFATWLGEVERARAQGFAVDPGNVNRGVIGVAVPVEPGAPLRHGLAAAMFETEAAPDIEGIVDRLRAVAQLAARAMEA